MRKSRARWRRTSRGRSIPKLASTSSPSDPRLWRWLSLSRARGSAGRMKIDQVGEVGVVLTDANEPVLSGGDQIIGYRSLKYAIFKSVSLAKKTLVEPREGWVWQTRRRLLLLDMEWLDLPGGKKGKRYHEIPLEETIDVVPKRKRVLLVTKDKEHGKVVFEFRPFGAASRLLAWLTKEKEHSRRREEGTLRSPYREEDR